MDSSKIDMSLDDIIKMNKPIGMRGGASRGASRGRWNSNRGGSGGRGGGFRQNRGRVAKPDAGQVRPQWNRFFNPGNNRTEGGADSGAKLLISNLDFGVSDEDIKELFGEFGPMRRTAVHYDRSGRSMGTAEVIYERYGSAQKAVSQYNGVPLDGRSMNIQIVSGAGASASNASDGRSFVPRSGGHDNRVRGNFSNRGRGRGGSRGGRGGGRGGRDGGGGIGGGGAGRSGGSERRDAPTKEQLDAELDLYNANME